MKKNKYLTNQELLSELKQRSVDLTQDEFILLVSIIIPYQEKVMKLIQDISPQTHQWVQEKREQLQEQLQQERTDQKVAELKKSL